MKEAIKKLIEKWGCSHDWRKIEEIKVFDDFGAYWEFLYVCNKCGKFKKVKI